MLKLEGFAAGSLKSRAVTPAGVSWNLRACLPVVSSAAADSTTGYLLKTLQVETLSTSMSRNIATCKSVSEGGVRGRYADALADASG